MTYALIKDGVVAHKNLNMNLLKTEFPNVSFPKNFLGNPDIRAEYGVAEIVAVAAPVSDAHNVAEVNPTLIDGKWTQTWEQTPKSAEELTAQAIFNRVVEYGTAEQQIEYITENGLEAWQTKVTEIKAKYPKP